MDELDKGVETQVEDVTTPVEDKKEEVKVEQTEEKVEKAATNDDLNTFYNPTKKEDVEEKVPEAKPEPIVYDLKTIKDVSLDEQLINDFKEFATSKSLKQEEAQKLVDFTEKAIKTERDKTRTLLVERAKLWDEQTRVDKEIGGTNIVEKMGVAKNFITKFGNDQVRELFRVSGFGSNPEVLRMFYRAGKAFSEDNFVSESNVKLNKRDNLKNESGETMFHFPSLERK